jgi:hypothetical protein
MVQFHPRLWTYQGSSPDAAEKAFGRGSGPVLIEVRAVSKVGEAEYGC